MPRRQDALEFIGEKYHKVTVIEDCGIYNNKRYVMGECECGEKRRFELNSLKHGNTKSCGCLLKAQPKDFMGKRFNSFIVIDFIGYIDGKAKVVAKCDCGEKKNVNLTELSTWHIKSCGCKRKTKGGLSKHPLHKVWQHMIDRCYDIKNEKYHVYGGRGVRVCEEWRTNYLSFYTWAIERWEAGLQIDKDILSHERTGNLYSPNYCCFITPKENSRNRSNNRIIEYKGKAQCISQWAEELNISRDIIKNRLKWGWDIDKIFTEPIRKLNRK